MPFSDLIKGLTGFEKRLVSALALLQKKQNTLSLQTSRFELCMLLRMEHNENNIKRLEAALERLQEVSFHAVAGGSGFAVATTAIRKMDKDPNSEKLVITLGSLFTLS